MWFRTALHAKKDEDLFIVDKKGDEKGSSFLLFLT